MFSKIKIRKPQQSYINETESILINAYTRKTLDPQGFAGEFFKTQFLCKFLEKIEQEGIFPNSLHKAGTIFISNLFQTVYKERLQTHFFNEWRCKNQNIGKSNPTIYKKIKVRVYFKYARGV